MRLQKLLACIAIVFLVSIAYVWAQEAKPEGKVVAGPVAGDEPKLFQPWNKLSNLTSEQRTKIQEIHEKANEQVNDIRKKENSDIMAVLTDEQKAELKAMKKKESAERKMKSGDQKETKSESPAPAAPAAP